MSGLALSIILASAFIHAFWNLLVKRVGSGVTFTWMFTTLSWVLLAPIAAGVLIWERVAISGIGFAFMCGTAVLHLVYFFCLQRGYRTGDLSLVYPLARGTGPMLATVVAIALFGERPSALALVGVALIIGGVFVITSETTPHATEHTRSAVMYGLLTGLCIASYSLWDKYAVSRLSVHPLILEAFSSLGISALLTPYALRNRETIREEWSQHWKEVIGVAVLAPLSYILILFVMRQTPLSYVAPTREISILIGAVLGTRFLGEQHTLRRMIAASAMVGGVVALAVG